ncbi:MAG: hypothetical protein JWR38_5648 [Mucilaginibacter sp.]|nr:hypothetical protein [Mucilaginibacter sp.]
MSITTYGLQHIKKEIEHLPQEQVSELLLRLARYKKENKELLAYLLFEAYDEAAFIEKVKAEAGFMFSQLPALSYNAAKGMRKILRLLGKYTKFSGSKNVEIELLLNFCDNYLEYADRRTSYKPIRLILTRQAEKIKNLISKLHEDLQFDYLESYNTLLTDAEMKLAWFKKSDYLL